jgi:NAD(P)-dependent dehydrogenase (short-subunit alcohol dehydrogenase family)
MTETKIALVTGGGSGIGRAAAFALAGAGFDVVVTGRRLEPLEETAEAIRALGRKALAISCDVGDPVQVGDLSSGCFVQQRRHGRAARVAGRLVL